MHQGQGFDFIGLATADEQGGVGCLSFASQAGHRLKAAGFGEQPQFLQIAIEMWQTEIHAHQQGRRGF